MISFQLALRQGCAIRHRNWPPFHYAKLAKGSGGQRKLYRCYPDGHLEILDVEIGELRREDGWSVECVLPDGPVPAA